MDIDKYVSDQCQNTYQQVVPQHAVVRVGLCANRRAAVPGIVHQAEREVAKPPSQLRGEDPIEHAPSAPKRELQARDGVLAQGGRSVTSRICVCICGALVEHDEAYRAAQPQSIQHRRVADYPVELLPGTVLLCASIRRADIVDGRPVEQRVEEAKGQGAIEGGEEVLQAGEQRRPGEAEHRERAHGGVLRESEEGVRLQVRVVRGRDLASLDAELEELEVLEGRSEAGQELLEDVGVPGVRRVDGKLANGGRKVAEEMKSVCGPAADGE